MSDLEELNRKFALGDALRFEAGEGGLTRARIRTAAATGEIYLHGAHLTRWQPADAAEPVLFMSERSQFAAGKAIRGGVPIVFPWFADRKAGPGPTHGFARTSLWTVKKTETLGDGAAIELELLAQQDARSYGYDYFVLTYRVELGRELRLSLEVYNFAERPLPIEEALHAYFAVSDIEQVRVSGLGGTDYLDRANHARRERQGKSAIRFAGETDQLHLNTPGPVTIEDPGWGRRIVLEKQGSWSTVVWNPWQTKAASLADLGGDAWPHMVCVEPANAADNAVLVSPGATHAMRVAVRVER